MIGRKAMWNFLSQWCHVKLWRKCCMESSKKGFSNGKKWFRERSSGTSLQIFSCLTHNKVSIWFFLFNYILELIRTREFFKKLKLHSPKWLMQFQLFEELTHASDFQIELETVWLPLLIITIVWLLVSNITVYLVWIVSSIKEICVL